MSILASETLLRENKKKNPAKNVTPSGNRTRASHSLWFQVQHYPFYTNLTFLCISQSYICDNKDLNSIASRFIDLGIYR